MRRAVCRSVPMTCNPPALVRFRQQFDVGAAAGHVRGDGHVADQFATGVLVLLPGDGDDLGLALVVFGVEHLMLDAVLALEHVGKHLALFHAGGADQHGPALVGCLLDLLDDRVPFLALGAIDAVLVIGADDRAIGGNGHHVQLVNLVEFLRFGLGRAGHAGAGSCTS